VSDYLDGFLFVVETSVGKQHQVVRKYWWHSTFGTGCITSSGFMLQPNVQERDFGRYAPSLANLDPSTVRMFYLDLCRVAHDHGMTKHVGKEDLSKVASVAKTLFSFESFVFGSILDRTCCQIE